MPPVTFPGAESGSMVTVVASVLEVAQPPLCTTALNLVVSVRTSEV